MRFLHPIDHIETKIIYAQRLTVERRNFRTSVNNWGEIFQHPTVYQRLNNHFKPNTVYVPYRYPYFQFIPHIQCILWLSSEDLSLGQMVVNTFSIRWLPKL